ncbi:MAG: hypothetical protein RSB32_05205 [Mucinivorans sp.]
MRYILYSILAVLGVVGCARQLSQDQKTVLLDLSFSRTYSNMVGEAPSDQIDQTINSITIFVVDGGVVKLKIPKVDMSSSLINIKQVGSQAKLYTIANAELCPAAASIVVGSPESDLLKLATTQSDDNGKVKGLVMSQMMLLDGVGNGDKVTLGLERSMARFDLKIEAGRGIEVKQVKVIGLPTSAPVFACGTMAADLNDAQVDITFPTPASSSVERLFYTHPLKGSPQGPTLTIEALYNGVHTTINKRLPSVARNTIYTLSLSGLNDLLRLNIDVSELIDGDQTTINGSNRVILLDKTKSVVDAQTTIDESGMRLRLPYTKTQATVVLDGDFDKKFVGQLGTIPGFSITPVSDAADAYQGSRYLITTDNQTKIGSNKNAVVLTFAPKDENDPSRMSRIVVEAENFAPFPVTTIEGIDWMSFNASSNETAFYPVLEDGQSLRDFMSVNASWREYSGHQYQWGPRNGTLNLLTWVQDGVGWQKLPNINGGITPSNATKWTGASMPCPRGWRVASSDDFQYIWPQHGTVIPLDGTTTTYTTAKGQTYTASIQSFGGWYMSHEDGGAARNLIITDGVKELIFPIAGYRPPNGWDVTGRQYSGYGTCMGTRSYWWCEDKVNGKVVRMGIEDGRILNTATGFGHNCWLSVRCVRDKTL